MIGVTRAIYRRHQNPHIGRYASALCVSRGPHGINTTVLYVYCIYFIIYFDTVLYYGMICVCAVRYCACTVCISCTVLYLYVYCIYFERGVVRLPRSHGTTRVFLSLKPHLGGFKNRFGPPKNYIWAARGLKMCQFFNFGSKHRENVPAPARGSSRSSRTRKTSKLSRFTILWYQVRLGGYFLSHEASGIPF